MTRRVLLGLSSNGDPEGWSFWWGRWPSVSILLRLFQIIPDMGRNLYVESFWFNRGSRYGRYVEESGSIRM